MQKRRLLHLAVVCFMIVTFEAASNAQNGSAPTNGSRTAAVVPPPDYVIGPNDRLSVVFWREKELSAEVVVRPDGKISLPLLNDVHASGLTPEQLRLHVADQAKRYVTDPMPTVVVVEIHSRKVFITGEVEKPGEYQLNGPTTVLQLIAMAGGVREYADREKILVLRQEGGKEVGRRFNYKDVVAQRNMEQNILLKPGDTVVVP